MAHPWESQPPARVREATIAALGFVYPSLRVGESTPITPDLAVLAFFLARALDSTSRITYGAFQFYSDVVKGVLTGGLSWADIPLSAAEAVINGVRDTEPQRNALVSNYIRWRFPLRLVKAHLEDPDTHPLPTLRIDPTSRLDRLVYKLD